MRRRAFLASAAVLALPVLAQTKAHRVGLVLGQNPQNPDSQRMLQVFVEAMKQLGYEQGRNLDLAVRYFQGDRGKIPAIADELIQWRADVLVANVSGTAVALKQKTSTIPIVMVTALDPVAQGLAESLARPGGNVTGMTSFGLQTFAKLVELGAELMPSSKRFALLVNPQSMFRDDYISVAARAADARGIPVVRLNLNNAGALGTFGSELRRARADLLVVMTDPVLYALRDDIVRVASEARLPSIAIFQEFIAAGAIATLGFDFVDSYRNAARYVDKILKGAKPAELPIEQPVRFDLILNMKAARSLGVTFPRSVLARADKVIE